MRAQSDKAEWTVWENDRPRPSIDPVAIPKARWGGVVDLVTREALFDPGTVAEAIRAGQVCVVLAVDLEPKYLDALDTSKARGTQAHLARALKLQFGLVDREIGLALGLTRADANCLRRLFDAAPALRDAVIDMQASIEHARLLLARSLSEQTLWIQQSLQKGWSARQLSKAMKAGKSLSQGQGTADRQAAEHYAAQLTERLQTPVRLVPGRGGCWELSVTWFGVEQLQGVLESLSSGAPTKSGAEDRRREFQLELTTGELDDLTGHLVRD